MITIALFSDASPPEIRGTDPSQIVEQVKTCRQLTRLKSNVMTLHVMGGPVQCVIVIRKNTLITTYLAKLT